MFRTPSLVGWSHFLSPNYYRVCTCMNNLTNVTCRAGSAYPSGTSWITTVFGETRVAYISLSLFKPWRMSVYFRILSLNVYWYFLHLLFMSGPLIDGYTISIFFFSLLKAVRLPIIAHLHMTWTFVDGMIWFLLIVEETIA